MTARVLKNFRPSSDPTSFKSNLPHFSIIGPQYFEQFDAKSNNFLSAETWMRKVCRGCVRLFGNGRASLVWFDNRMESKRADWKLNLPHFVDPSSGSWILRSKCFKDSVWYNLTLLLSLLQDYKVRCAVWEY
jgi:hypothetical protein